MSDEVEVSVPVSTEPAATPENVAAPVEETQDQLEVKTEAAAKTFTQEEVDAIAQKERKRAEAIAERRALKAYRETLERFAPAQPAQPAPQTNDAPKRDAYATDEQWLDARDEWRDNRREQQAQQERQQQQAQTLNAKTENFYTEAQKIPGFDRDAFEELPLTRAIAAAIIEADAPAQLMAHLAAHPEEAERIAGLSPTRQVAEMAKLEGKLTTAPKVSSAPAPIKPIGTRGSATNSDPSKLSMDDYIAQRKTQGARWAR